MPLAEGRTSGETAYLALKRQARSLGRNTDELFRLDVLEGALGRIPHSEYRDDFVLKGGVLLAAFGMRRPTKDIDVQSMNMSNDLEDVVPRVRDILAIQLRDGVDLDLGALKGEVIRNDDEYSGIRIRVRARVGVANTVIGLDVGFGDPIWPEPQEVEIPRILNEGEPIVILGYPDTMVVAKKAVTALQRGEANTCWRGFADIVGISGARGLKANDLSDSLVEVANYRNLALRSQWHLYRDGASARGRLIAGRFPVGEIVEKCVVGRVESR